MSSTPQRSYPVRVEVDGKDYSASYSIQSRIVTVVYGGMECSRQLGGVSADVLAMNLLRDMVKAGTGPAPSA